MTPGINRQSGLSGADHGAEYRKSVLENGVVIVSERIASVRSVAVGFWIDVGSRDEDPALNGISHFIEHTVFKGTRHRRTHQIAQYIEAVGGYVNAFTGKDATCYYVRVRDQHLERAINLLADIVQYPLFEDREIAKEKQVIIEEMHSIEDDAEDIINDYFEKTLFGNHPLGQPVIGCESTVSALTGASLHDFVRTHYTAGNLVVAASGNVDHHALVRLCERTLRQLPAGSARKRTKPRPRAVRHQTLERQVQQTHLVMGRMVSGLRHPDSYALSLLNALLGDGMSSRLFQRIRERHGYAYTVYSFLTLYEDTGIFGVYIGAENGNVERSKDIMLRELDDLRRNPVSRRELNRAREQVIGGMLLGLESMSTRMTRIGKDELVFGRELSVDSVIRNLMAVTPESLCALAASACDEGAFFSTTIVPAG
jgi:predicted Zn-dependent peptidase